MERRPGIRGRCQRLTGAGRPLNKTSDLRAELPPYGLASGTTLFSGELGACSFIRVLALGRRDRSVLDASKSLVTVEPRSTTKRKTMMPRLKAIQASPARS